MILAIIYSFSKKTHDLRKFHCKIMLESLFNPIVKIPTVQSETLPNLNTTLSATAKKGIDIEKMKQLPSAILNIYWSQRSWTTYKRNDGSIKTAAWAPTKLINDVEKYADYGPNYANPAGTRRVDAITTRAWHCGLRVPLCWQRWIPARK